MNNMNDQVNVVKQIALAMSKYGGKTYYTGGYVRDLLLKHPIESIDVEVHNVDLETFKEVLSKFGTIFKLEKKYEAYGLSNYEIDISCLDMPIEESILYKDLTLNAILIDALNDEIIDLVNGVKDLNNKVLNYVSRDNFIKDVNRVYRVARLATQYKFKISDTLMDCCKTINVKDAFGERVYYETSLALMSDQPSVYFDLLKQMNALHPFFKELAELIGLEQNKKYHLEDCFEHTMYVLDHASLYKENVDHPLEFMYSALCHDLGKGVSTTVDEKGVYHAYNHELYSPKLAEKMLTRLMKNKELNFYVKDLSLHHMRPRVLFEDNAKRKEILQLCDDTYFPKDLIYLSLCDNLGKRSLKNQWNEDIKLSYLTWKDKSLTTYKLFCNQRHITGNDLLEMGFEDTSKFKEIVKRARELQYGNNLVDVTRQIAKEYSGNGAKIRLFVERLRKKHE